MSDQFTLRYANLNPAQKKAVDTTEGPVLVIAGPGSGKTEILSLRVANILRTAQVGPQNILCLTFTESGAHAMRTRLQGLIGKDAYRVSIFTFHAFCNNIITRYGEYFYNAASYTQVSDVTKAEIFDELFQNLTHTHPLSSYHPEEGYVYKKDLADRVSHLKRGGYTPAKFKGVIDALATEYETLNTVVALWPQGRMSIKNIAPFEVLANALTCTQSTTGIILGATLGKALAHAREQNTTEAVSAWKKKYLHIDGEDIIIKDSYQQDKIQALADLYTQYTNTLHTRGLYDYDDMILDVAEVLRTNDVLRAELEEQYQYILVDEFQDTNEAQMNVVRALTSSPIHEGQANVCVVGDDDQAVYKFQGAEVSHIMHFKDAIYKNVETIVLDQNYRSTQAVLDIARGVITQGETRLENTYADITKVLLAANTKLPPGTITIHEYSSDVHEYTAIANRIKDGIAHGVTPSEIAVLARGHRELRTFLPYLDHALVPYEYVKRANVFEEIHVQELITICEYAASVLGHNHIKNELLPIILSYPFWNISRSTLFSIAATAKKDHLSWMEVLETHTDPMCVRAHASIVQIAGDAHTSPLERALDTFIHTSGFKEYYFNADILKNTPTKYVTFLASLKTFFESLREYKQGEMLHIHDVPSFVEIYKTHKLSLTSDSVFVKNKSAIQIMTAHASKGLEFEHVYIVSVHDTLWTKRPRANKIPVPSPLVPLITPAGDTEDDFIRLLYVAMTRAKHTLSISGYEPIVRYIADTAEKNTSEEELVVQAHEISAALITLPYTQDEKRVLEKIVENYIMPITHVHNFLNVIDGGPLYFIEQNLFNFPKPFSVSGAYGSAVHKALETYTTYPQRHAGTIPSDEYILSIFDAELSKARLDAHDHIFTQKKGQDMILQYLTHARTSFLITDKAEVDMRHEGVLVGDAHITGKIDLLRIIDDQYTIIDFKTGKPIKGSDERLSTYEQYKAHIYHQQLLYYKILLEGSTHYKLPVRDMFLEFIEPDTHGEYILWQMGENHDGIVRMKKIIEAVYRKISTLDFPDISKYEKTLSGVIAFEDDLIAGNI